MIIGICTKRMYFYTVTAFSPEGHEILGVFSTVKEAQDSIPTLYHYTTKISNDVTYTNEIFRVILDEFINPLTVIIQEFELNRPFELNGSLVTK